jgi:MFS family permease|tara:strand:- start:613 stop:1806 length:1194 start_codon:yes stop_codon:yes gene_type:complete
MTFFSAPGQTFFISLLSGEIRHATNLSDGEFAAIYSLATLCSAVVMIWSGGLIDKIGLKKLSIALVFGLATGCGILSISSGVVSLVIGLFLLRQFGQGLMYLTSTTTMVRYLEKNRGKSTALAGMGYAISEAVVPSIVVALLLWVGWRSSWQVSAVFLLLVMVPAILYLLQGHQQRHHQYLAQLSQFDNEPQKDSLKRQWTRPEVMRDKFFYLLMPGLMSQPLMFTGFIFHQVHLVESKGWSLSVWASLFFMYALVSVGTKIISGFLVDRYGAIRMVPWLSIPMGIGLVLLAVSSNIIGGGVFLALMGITVGFQSTVSAPFWSEMYGIKHLGSIKSLATSVMVLSTAISPIIIGGYIDHGIKIETLAMASAIFVFLTSALAWYACQVRQRSCPTSEF